MAGKYEQRRFLTPLEVEKLAEQVSLEISEEQAINSDIGGDSDAEDFFPISALNSKSDKTRTRIKRKIDSPGTPRLEKSDSAPNSKVEESESSDSEYIHSGTDNESDQPLITNVSAESESDTDSDTGPNTNINWTKQAKDPQIFGNSIFQQPFGSKDNLEFMSEVVEQSNLYAQQKQIELELDLVEFKAWLDRIERIFHQLKCNKNMKRLEIDYAMFDDISACKWLDRGKAPVCVLSSMHNPSSKTTVLRKNAKGIREEVPCPESIAAYNKFMGGVDKMDQYLAAYNVSQKSRRWWGDSILEQVIEDVIAKYAIQDDEEEPVNIEELNHLKWSPVDGTSLKQFPFTVSDPGIKTQLYTDYIGKHPYDVFKLFITDEIITFMVKETNRYAEQQLTKEYKPKSRIKKWTPTTNEEMEKFLATELLARKTHLVGTLRNNRKYNPKEVVQKKLKLIEIYAKESGTGIMVCKWRDKRDVLVLSTLHKDNMKPLQQRGGETEKPEVILEYNKAKAYIDLADQIKAYSHCLRRGTKWYRKLAFEILVGSTIVNAHLVFKQVTQENISIIEFREKLCLSLLRISETTETTEDAANTPETEHVLQEQSSRLRCVVCYSDMQGRKIALNKASRTKYQCVSCKKNYCVECFFVDHHFMQT
ncbi:piggybac transposable element-derived protein 4 [Holotrichia oblita]|uniref:Piggybac transposable element-derived protein 4 n=1 Tax=Holotrichia oblita TaxID=644536 RepID=A0ACB9TRR3_HOLOL|nr:piggybac transposable element-derived protein 4 [Holotrichia oblita]